MTEWFPLRDALADALRDGGLDPAAVELVVRRALDEDLALGPDVTTLATVPEGARATGDITPRSPGVLAGLPVAAAVLELVGGHEVEVSLHAADGMAARTGSPALTVSGPTRSLLTAERTALNLVCHLSGIATLTRRWVDAVAGTDAGIRDTRKTTPGLRALEKYAVRCGGGVNHRMALGDAALVKDNHVAAAGGIAAAVAAVRAHAPEISLEVECDTLDQVREAIDAGVALVLLDNFSLADTRAAVELARPAGVRLEASGGLTLDRAAEVAATGVDYLAVGALTHSAPVLDLGFDLR
ncbi:carboxylating nicotinate-nucleotide diphosphorylase [Blastococcus xanthinilyticus]|uniref:Nicotinate-nucleotide pyrophosphorylase [carboxylating] n=1 Tax=Blastococcus xanthinilyticus TaxID=1564164 RepID=A0A5S5CXC3_9ACTN|nr:carboxylating nicotinate-nucleotide diphosphorylase [Blastococcus xanthinilyticus]TYP87648.1 nicotinate-nucleotide pyrophosphorylase [carboxylating] [Blastococcus xanthinilyticus]